MFSKYLIVLLLVAASCSKSKSKGESGIEGNSVASIKQQTLAFTDSIDLFSRNGVKQESLIYTINDYSFYVSRYIRNSIVALYIEHGYSAGSGTVENRYYLKNGKVVFYSQTTLDPDNPFPYKQIREFYPHSGLRLSDYKIGASPERFDTAEFKPRKPGNRSIKDEIKKLTDAIYQRGAFSLTLEGITQYPGAKYLILSSNKFNSYRAALLIEKEDALIKSVSADPERYKGRKVELEWELKGRNRALYVSGRLRQ